MNQFLIPANSKKSMLIFGVFNPFDLILFGCGIGASLLMLMTLNLNEIPLLILALSPLLISAFLVFPIANYHNPLTFLICVYHFYTERQKFIWKGWCAQDGTEDTNKKQ